MSGALRQVPALLTGAAVLALLGSACRHAPPGRGAPPAVSAALERGGETHLKGVRLLTGGGENAEAYWDDAGERLIFQSTRDGAQCDQIYTMRADGSGVRRVSSGSGRTTCAYFFPGSGPKAMRGRVLYSTTETEGSSCPPRPGHEQGYVWPVYAAYDIVTARDDGSDIRPLTRSPGYNAEATISRDGERIVFTSTRDGDLELYTMRWDGSDVRRVTRSPGYDGGAFFSPDGKRLVWRGRHPEGDELAEFTRLLGQGLVRPSRMELFVGDADGSNARQIGSFGGANFCPYWHPDGRRIVFASNMADPKGRNFDLYLVRDDGTGLERVTTDETFDGFPMFDPAGRRIVFASNRGAAVPGETNIAVADWAD